VAPAIATIARIAAPPPFDVRILAPPLVAPDRAGCTLQHPVEAAGEATRLPASSVGGTKSLLLRQASRTAWTDAPDHRRIQ
jgi:hypothetical protein